MYVYVTINETCMWMKYKYIEDFRLINMEKTQCEVEPFTCVTRYDEDDHTPTFNSSRL